MRCRYVLEDQATWYSKLKFPGSFLPLTLEQLAREQGHFLSSNLPCVGPNAPSAAGNGTASTDDVCVVPLMGLNVNTASFAMYTFSLAVLIQALTLVSFSALADYGKMAVNLPLHDAVMLILLQKITERPFCWHSGSLGPQLPCSSCLLRRQCSYSERSSWLSASPASARHLSF